MPDIPVDDEGLIRLQKLLALAGVASRRHSEELMLDEQVTVNGEVVTRLGTKVNPVTDLIRVKGKRLPPISDKVYLLLHKPRGVVSTMSDPEGRPTLQDFVNDRPERLFHVGRLDTDTSGLIILTNDGDLAQRLAHPSYEMEKTYVAQVKGHVWPRIIKQLTEGVTIDDRVVDVRQAKILDARTEQSIIELVIHEGRNRIVRRLLAEVGHPVRQLARTRIGDLTLGSLKPGQVRELAAEEVGMLLDTGGL
jgi:23S rRNA pseudouridine2605 synthase